MPRLAKAIPACVEALTIYAHDDKAGQDGAQALAAVLKELVARRKRPKIEVVIEGLGL